MFIDSARVFVKAGDGGNGTVSFERRKYVACGGPDGGDGGRGGDVVFVADKNLNTLMDFKYKNKYFAQNGDNGRGSRMTGKNGADVIIKVPVGTLLKEEEWVIADLDSDGSSFVVARGGRGGWGNVHFTDSVRQAPNFAKKGLPGDEREIFLELKLIADVGLVGFPNVGKSTFLSVVSSARPKIADYHFTTLVPNLGVVKLGESSFVIADIPGIIEGAHQGIGLGYRFLKHIERTRLILHIVDVSGVESRDPLNDFDIINREMALYGLADKEQIVVANKSDVPGFADNFARFKSELEQKYKIFAISAVKNDGVQAVVNFACESLTRIPKPYFEVNEQKVFDRGDNIQVKLQDGVYIITGKRIENLVKSLNFDDSESLHYFHWLTDKMGLNEILENAGIRTGDTISVCGMQFEYMSREEL